MLRDAMMAVADFHRMKNVDFRQRLGEHANRMLLIDDVIANMQQASRACLRFFQATTPKDYRYLRAHLLLEERAETLQGLQLCSEELLLDALCDDAYVSIGTAITFDLPLSEGFAEVHRSNMTKRVSPGNGDPRLSRKGDAYEPPKLKEILCEYRNMTARTSSGTRR